MSSIASFSEAIEIPMIAEGPGVAIIEDERGEVLHVIQSKNIRRRIGELLDSEGHICVHGPKIYRAQRDGRHLYVRWKLTPDYKAEYRELVTALDPR